MARREASTLDGGQEAVAWTRRSRTLLPLWPRSWDDWPHHCLVLLLMTSLVEHPGSSGHQHVQCQGANDANMVELVEDQMEWQAKEGSWLTLLSWGWELWKSATHGASAAQPLRSITYWRQSKVRRIGGLKLGTKGGVVLYASNLPLSLSG
jgi:hypothetical protein